MQKPGVTNRLELLAPAGDWEAMRAAVVNGADAVYFGLSAFNARHRAANFSLEELPEVMGYLHGHNVRGYVALNTLIFSDELAEAVRFIREIAEAGVDAIIVQDLGLAQLAHRYCPTLEIHGSTQMTLTESLGIEFVKSLGVQRVVLARELSTGDIQRIAGETAVPLEVFIHGALCVSYSGQCLTSEALGGRSANRGQCAQACRLPYDLVVDGQKRELGDKAYLLSPQDLAAYDLVDKLAELRVACLKIEGRLKSAHYVAAATQTYRAAVDAAAGGVAFSATPEQKLNLAQSFSRGFTHGFLDGVDHQSLVHAKYSKSRGVKAGRVAGSTERGVLVELERHVQLKAGDGVMFDEGHPEQDEQGGRISLVQQGRRAGVVEIVFFRGDINPQAIVDGCTVWKTNDPEISKRLATSFNRDRVAKRERIDADVVAREGELLSITVADEAGHGTRVSWDRLLERAEKFPATMEIFRAQFGRLGDTPFELGAVTVNGEIDGVFPPVMIPKSVLNDLRRQAAAELLRQRDGLRHHAIAEPEALETMRGEAMSLEISPSPGAPGEGRGEGLRACNTSDANSTQPSPYPSPRVPGEGTGVRPTLNVLVRTMAQLDAVLACPVDSGGVERGMVYCEFEDVRQYSDAVKLARSSGVAIGLATVRIVKPHEHGLLATVAKAEPDAILVRNLAGLSYFAERSPQMPLIADYSLNVSNELTAAILARQGVRRMTPSYDLNWKQLSSLLARFSPLWFEAVIHQHMPMFHMEHCVFAHTLSNGKDYRDCGRPCEKHQVDLRDRAAAAHPLVADAGCRNTVYNGTAQSAAEFVPRMVALGLRQFRVELLREPAGAIAGILERYGRVLSGLDDGRTAWRQLKVLNQLGVTRGTLETAGA